MCIPLQASHRWEARRRNTPGSYARKARCGNVSLNALASRWSRHMHKFENSAKQRMLAGELVICMGLRQARSVDIAPIVGACGFDALYIDMEHSPVSIETVSAICTAAVGFGVTPLVRVPGHDSEHLSRALDGGAMGIIVPHVDTAEQARAMVRMGKYPPVGHRSV